MSEKPKTLDALYQYVKTLEGKINSLEDFYGYATKEYVEDNFFRIVHDLDGYKLQPIRLYAGDNNGAAMVVQSGGLFILGSGESAKNLYDELISTKTVSPQTETTYIASDNAVHIVTNCNDIGNRRQATITGGDTGLNVSGIESMPINGCPKLLWSGAYQMTDTQTVTLSESIQDMPNGLVMAWSGYADNAAQNYNWHFFFISKDWVKRHSGNGVNMPMATVSLNSFAAKYVYITDTTIRGNASNNANGTGSTGIKYTNNQWVLREVYGV